MASVVSSPSAEEKSYVSYVLQFFRDPIKSARVKQRFELHSLMSLNQFITYLTEDADFFTDFTNYRWKEATQNSLPGFQKIPAEGKLGWWQKNAALATLYQQFKVTNHKCPLHSHTSLAIQQSGVAGSLHRIQSTVSACACPKKQLGMNGQVEVVPYSRQKFDSEREIIIAHLKRLDSLLIPRYVEKAKLNSEKVRSALNTFYKILQEGTQEKQIEVIAKLKELRKNLKPFAKTEAEKFLIGDLKTELSHYGKVLEKLQ